MFIYLVADKPDNEDCFSETDVNQRDNEDRTLCQNDHFHYKYLFYINYIFYYKLCLTHTQTHAPTHAHKHFKTNEENNIRYVIFYTCIIKNETILFLVLVKS